MIKGIIIIIMLLNIYEVPYSSKDIEKVDTSVNINEYSSSPGEIIKIDEILDDKTGALSENEKETLIHIKDKIKSYQVLTQADVDLIRDCDLKIIRNKLGDVKFEEYSKLIKKRATKDEFDQIERLRLFELEKELRGIK